MHEFPVRSPETPRARFAVFVGVLAVALSAGLATGLWAGPVDDPGYSTSADPHAGH